MAAQALHRYPDGALISFALGIPAGIPLDVDMERRLELFVPGEPFAEDPRVDRLQRLRHRPDAPEFRPLAGGDFEHLHPLWHFAALVGSGDIITEMFHVRLILHTDAELSYHALRHGLPDGFLPRLPGRVLPAVFPAEFLPEPWNLPVGLLKGKSPREFNS